MVLKPMDGINYLTSTGAEVLPSTVCFSIDTSWVLVLVGKNHGLQMVGAENLGFLKLQKKKSPRNMEKPGSRFEVPPITYICRFESSLVSKIGGFFLE